MGNDFLTAQAKRHRKTWAAKYKQAATDMHSAEAQDGGLKVIAEVKSGCALRAQEELMLVKQDSQVYVCRENDPVAEVKLPPAELINRLEKNCGVMPVLVDEQHTHANAVSVKVLDLERP